MTEFFTHSKPRLLICGGDGTRTSRSCWLKTKLPLACDVVVSTSRIIQVTPTSEMINKYMHAVQLWNKILCAATITDLLTTILRLQRTSAYNAGCARVVSDACATMSISLALLTPRNSVLQISDICVVVATCSIMAHSITFRANGPPLPEGTKISENSRKVSDDHLQAFSEQETWAVARLCPQNTLP